MTANYILLERIELNASASSVVFNNIPQSGYTDLKVVISARDSAGTDSYNDIFMSFNGAPGGSLHSYRTLYSIGTTAGSLSASSIGYMSPGGTVSNGNTSNTFANTEIYIPNYTSSTNKSVSADGVTEANTGTNGRVFLNMTAGLWASTAAITSITFSLTGSLNYLANSTFSLYGIAAVGTTPVIAPKATGGNLIENDGTYWIHTFTSSGTFTPLQGLSCDYLVVAGGGGGGADASGNQGGGGGGAGAMLTGSTSVITNAYTITVGAGGATSSTGAGTIGANSVFSTITSTGGGFGGFNTGNGGNGGSGGGAGGYGSGTGGTATTGGNAGGNAAAGRAGGGGGASAAGGTGSTANGGNGTASSITGTSVTYAGGGGGGATNTNNVGGTGGGGAGARSSGVDAVAGTVNTGGGGGGGNFHPTNAGAAGGSGVVIIRYLVA